jgi:hypothetical protein
LAGCCLAAQNVANFRVTFAAAQNVANFRHSRHARVTVRSSPFRVTGWTIFFADWRHSKKTLAEIEFFCGVSIFGRFQFCENAATLRGTIGRKVSLIVFFPVTIPVRDQ